MATPLAMMAAGAQVAGAVTQSLAGYQAGMINSQLLEDKAAQLERSTKFMQLEADNTALQLTQNYNTTLANNIVMSAVQGRSGGSVDAVAEESNRDFMFDQEMVELSTKFEQAGAKIQASDARLAALQEKRNARKSIATGLLSGFVGASNAALIGGK